MAWLPDAFAGFGPQKAPGLLGLLGMQANPYTDYLGSHSYELLGLASGLLGGSDLGQGLSAGFANAANGRQIDQQAADKRASDAETKRQQNATLDWLKSKGYDDLVAAANSGLPISDVWQAGLARAKGPAPSKPIVINGQLVDPDTYQVVGDYRTPATSAPNAPKLGVDEQWDPHYGGGWAHLKSMPIPGSKLDPTNAQSISPEALDLIATQYLAGDKSAITGYARNADMRAQIANAVAAKANAMGMDGNGIAAEISAYGGNVAAQKAAGTRAAQVGMAASEANQMADIALQASKNVPRGNLLPWNALTNAVATGTSDPKMAAFVTATTSLVNAYARAVSPLGAPTDAMRQHAEQMLNTAQSPEAYAAVIAQMKNEMAAALNAPAEISQSLKSSVAGSGQSQGGMNTTSTGVQWSVSP